MTKADIKPLVSAIITTHNRADLLPRALDSVIAQTYENLEIVVVDDGSTDRTTEIVDHYREHISLKYIRLGKSLGAPRARNKGIEAANGVFVAGLDDDDAWTENRIEKLVETYDDTFAFLTTDVRMMHRKGAPVWKKPEVITLDDLLYSNYVGNQGLIKKERLITVGGFDESLTAAQDYDLWIRLAAKFGPVKNVQKPLQTIYMDHQSERITDRSAFEGYLQFYKKHKQRMNAPQRKYQLYKIRRVQGKPESIHEFISCVPAFRYWKEVKRFVLDKVIR